MLLAVIEPGHVEQALGGAVDFLRNTTQVLAQPAPQFRREPRASVLHYAQRRRIVASARPAIHPIGDEWYRCRDDRDLLLLHQGKHGIQIARRSKYHLATVGERSLDPRRCQIVVVAERQDDHQYRAGIESSDAGTGLDRKS